MDTVCLKLTTTPHWDENCKLLNNLDKESIKLLIAPVRRVLKSKMTILSPESEPEFRPLYDALLDATLYNRLHKEDIVRLYLALGSNIDNILAISLADPHILNTWRLLATSGEVTSHSIHAVLGHKMGVATTNHWSRRQPTCELPFFWVTPLPSNPYDCWNSPKASYTYTLHSDLRRRLLPHLFSADITSPILTDTIPPHLTVENFRHSVGKSLAYIASMAASGVKTNTKGLLSATALRTFRDSTGFKDFTNLRHEKYPLSRLELFVFAYFQYAVNRHKDTGADNAGEFARYALNQLPQQIISTQFAYFLPAFHGFTKHWTQDSLVVPFLKEINSILSCCADRWMSLSNLDMLILCHESDEFADEPILFNGESRFKSRLTRLSDADADTRPGDILWSEEVDIPFVLHWIRFLCAIGVLEIASDFSGDPADSDPEKTEYMRYIRMTDLGRYAFGYSDTYADIDSETMHRIDFDGRNGIITLESNNDPRSFLFESLADRISPTRFRITPKSLLRGCDSAFILGRRIHSLRNTLSLEIMYEMRDVIDEALRRAQAGERSARRFCMIKLRSDLPDLIRDITGNPDLRKHCILGEGGTLFVKESRLDNVRAMLQSMGYLFD